MTPVATPQIHEAELTLELLADLFAALESSARILEVRVQGGRTSLSAAVGQQGAASQVRLGTLQDELVRGVIRGVQIRYTHEGSDWIDTLLRRGPTLRLIRARVSGEPPPGYTLAP